MHSPPVSSRTADVPGRALAVLTALAGGLLVAFFAGPGRLAATGQSRDLADQHTLVDALRRAFVGYWNSVDRDLSPDLQGVVDYWFRFHVVKAVITTVLLIVLTVLGFLLWRAFLRAGGLAFASAGVVVTMLALVSLVTVMANVQGAAAPFSSLLPMLPGGATGGLADTLDQVRQRLNDAPDGHTPPALDVMIGDFSRYHAAMAVTAAIVAVALIAMSVVFWRRFATTGSAERRTRRVLGSFGVLSALLAAAVIVVAVANAGTAADPAPALAGFFDGGR